MFEENLIELVYGSSVDKGGYNSISLMAHNLDIAPSSFEATVVKGTGLAILKRPPQSLLGHAVLYLVSFSATAWMIRSVTFIGGNILIILFTYVPLAVTKVEEWGKTSRERISNGEPV